MIYIILLVLYLATSKLVLLPKARQDVKIDYQVGDMSDKLFILLMLPIYYTQG